MATEKRFRFQTFTERLNALDVNVSRTLECEEELDGLETHFLHAVTKWASINLTEAWSECLAEMNPLCRSLPMLVHHSEKIVDLLLGHLEKQKEIPDCVGAEPILGLISALARDLRKDLVPHLPRIFSALRDLIDPKNPKLLESIFQCHSYLIKYLGRYMADDMGKYISLYQPIFVHNKHYIRHFAAESFSYLMRRMQSEDSMEHALDLLYEMDFGDKVTYGADTLSIILFETMKSIQDQFHSRAMYYLDLLFKRNASATMPQMWALKATLLRMRNHAKNMDNAQQMLDLFFDHFPTTPGAEALWYLDVIASWIVTKPRTQGSFHCFVRRALLAIAKLDGCVVVEGKPGAFPPKTMSVRDAAGRCILALWRFLPDSTLQCISGRFIESHSHLVFPVEWSFFVEALRQNVQRFERTPFFSRAVEQAVAKIRDENSHAEEREEAWFVLEKVVLLGSTTPLAEILFTRSASRAMLKCALAWYKEERTAEECSIAAQAISKELQTSTDVALQADLVVLGSLVNMENLKQFVEGWWAERWDTYEVIEAVAQIAPRLGVPSHDLKHMFANCGSPDQRIRESTLRILRHIDDCILAKEVTAVSEDGELVLGDSLDAEVQLLVAACLRLEEIAPSLETERQKSGAVRTVLVQVSQGPRTWMAHAAVRIALSQLFVPFSTLWGAVVEHATILLEEPLPAEPAKKKRKKEKSGSVDGWWNNTLWRIVAKMIAKIRIAQPSDVVDEEDEKAEQVQPQSSRYQHRTKGMNIKNKRALDIDDCGQWDQQCLFADFVRADKAAIRWTDDVTVDEWSWKLLGKLLCQSKEKQKHHWVAEQMVHALEGRYVTRRGLCRSRSYFLHVCHAAASSLDCPPSLDPLVQFGTAHHMLLDYNATVQKCAVDILARLKSTRAVVEKYKQQLNHLCDDKSFRDALLTLAVEGSEDDRMFPRPEHTAQVMPLVHRIVFSKIFKRGNAIDKNSSQHSRRAAAYSTLSPAMEDQKGLAPLLTIMLENILETDMDDGTEGGLRCDIRRADRVKAFVESYDPSQEATWQPTKVWSWGGISLRVGEGMVTKYLGFMFSLQDFMTQLGTTLAPFAQLLVQMCVGILEQTSLSGKAQGDGSEKLLSTHRALVRGCLQRLQTLIKLFPMQVDWVKCLGPASTSLTHLIGQIPVSSGAAQVSAIAKFVCSWSEIPELFHLYDVFPTVLPSLFKVPAAPSALSIINNTDLRGGPVVEMVVNMALRLCRGGLLNLKAAKKEAKSFREAARQKRKKKREDIDSASEMSEDCDDENEDREPGFITNKERLENAAVGQKLLMPHVNVLLQSLHVLVSQRKTKRSKKYDQVVRLHELELMSTVAEWMTEPSVAYQLVDLLLKALADAPNTKNTNVTLLLMDSLIKLFPKALPWGLLQENFDSMIVVSSVHTRIAMLFSSLQDIRGRQKLGEVLVACEASLYFRDEQKAVGYLKESRDIPFAHRWRPNTSVVPAQPEGDAQFTQLHTAHLVHALNALKVSAALEPDADLHVDVLEDIASNFLTGEKTRIISGHFMVPFANHLTFVLAMETCDLGVRHSVERVLTTLATRLQENPADTGVLFVLQSRVVPSLRRILRSPYDDALRAGLKVLGHYVRALGPLAAEFDKNAANSIKTPGASYQALFHTDLVPLLKNSTGDEGGDLFGNLLHLQKHRRGRGLIMLSKAASTLSQPTLMHFVLPLCYNGLLQRSTATANFDPNYSENSLTCMQAAIARSTWNACLLYIRLLAGCLKQWRTRQKVIIKSICGCLNAFPFQGGGNPGTPLDRKDVGEDKDEAMDDKVRDENKVDAKDGEEEENGDEEEQENENALEVAVDQRQVELGNSLKKRVVPILKRILWDKSNVSTSSTQSQEYDEKKAKTTPDRGLIRVGVVGVLLHVFRYMATHDFHRQVPRLLYTLMEALESRDKEHRDEARKAVYVVMGALGPQWFVWLTKELKTRLTKGYQQPVCIFTTHCALAALVSDKNANAQNNSFLGKCQVGEVDRAVPTLLEMVEDELARVADPEKSEEEIKEHRGQVKEAKKLRGPDVLNLLARVTVPKKVLSDVVQFLYDLLCEERGVRLIGSAASRAYSQKYLHRVGELLQQTLAGLQLNPQFTHTMQVEFTSSLLSHGVTLLKHKDGQPEASLFGRSRIAKENTNPVRKKEEAITVQDGAAQGKGAWVGTSRQSGFDPHARAEVLATAGLQLMFKFVRSSGLQDLDDDTQRTLQDLTPQVVECFCSTKDSLLITAAKCLLRLQAWSPLPATLGRRVALTVLKVFQFASGQQDLSKRLQQRGHGGADLIPACSRLLTGLLHRDSSRSWFTELSQTSMRKLEGLDEENSLSKREERRLNKESTTFFDALLAQICVALDHKKLQPSALALLQKVILKRNILRASVYDCVDVVGELMVKSGSHSSDESIPKLCASIYVDFLLDYPHDTDGLDKRIGFLINNLTYSEEGGRRAVLNALHNVVTTFPLELLAKKYAAIIFLPVASRLSQEADPLTHEMLHILIKALLERVSADTRQHLLAAVTGWQKSPKPLLLAALAEALGLMTPVMAPKQRHNCLEILAQLVKTDTRDVVDHSSPVWRTVYCACKSFEELVKLNPKALRHDGFIEYLLGVDDCLVPSAKRHPWIVSIGLRLLADHSSDLNVPLGPLLHQVVLLIQGPLEHHGHLAHAAIKAVVRCVTALLADPTLARGGPGENDLQACVAQMSSNDGMIGEEEEEEKADNEEGATDGQMEEAKKGDPGEDEKEDNGDDAKDDEEDVVDPVDVPDTTLYERAQKGVKKEKKVEPLVVERSASSSSPPALRWAVVRLSYETRRLMGNLQDSAVRLGAIVRLFGHLSVLLPREVLAELLEPLLTPCFRLQTWSKDMPSREIKDISQLATLENNVLRGCLGKFAEETMDALSKSMGVENQRYAQALAKVRSAVMERRRKRKADKKLLLVKDPEKAKAQKIAKTVKKTTQRKRRKHEVVKQKRGLIAKGFKA
eukprot:GEMP01000138.1.p1 GENE.GEMP01000138.1~~GEMP01000138.1.p1  ORF type:complete len:2984 (+),score=778.20 GEMP01000138.1:39-8990(+)